MTRELLIQWQGRGERRNNNIVLWRLLFSQLIFAVFRSELDLTEKLVSVHLYNANALFKWFVREGLTDTERHQIILLQGSGCMDIDCVNQLFCG